MAEDKRLNEVIRVRRRPCGFVTMDKGFIENPALTWKAKGILAYLLSKPDNWKVIVGDVIKHAANGKDAVYSGLAELGRHGYYVKVPVRAKNGAFIRWESTVYELPEATNPIGPVTFPFSGHQAGREIPYCNLPDIPGKGLDKPSSPLPGFPEMDKPEMGNPDLDNPPRLNNDFNYNDFNHNQVSQSVRLDGRDATGRPDSRIEEYIGLIHANINYSDLAVSRPHDMRMVDEMVMIILDVVMSGGATVRIGGEDKPRALVAAQLMKLTYDDIEHAIEQFKSVGERIIKKKQYILTMLYNCKLELDSHYTNAVISDRWQ